MVHCQASSEKLAPRGADARTSNTNDNERATNFIAVTSAVLAQSDASSAGFSRVMPVAFNPRTAAIVVSVAVHLGLAVVAYARAPHPAAAASFEHSEPTVEITLSSSAASEPVIEPVSPSVARAVSPSAAASHSAAAAPHLSPALPVAPATVEAIAPAESVAPEAPRFVMQAPAVSGGTALSAQVGSASDHREAEALPFAEREVDSPAKLQSGSSPAYTAAAEAAGVEAELPLEVIVDRAGGVQSARGLQRAGYGLDEAALAAVRGYRFSPARRGGKPVAVRMRWVLRFQLR
jgi:protein TonB